MQYDVGALTTLAVAARHLAADPFGGAATSLDHVAAALSEALGAPVTLTVRTPGSRAPRLSAGTRALAVPTQRSAGSPLELPLRASGTLRGVLTVTSRASITHDAMTLLSGYADLLAIALASTTAQPGARPGAGSALAPDDECDAAAAAVLDEEAERAEIAALLHEGPVQALVAAKYALDRSHDEDVEPAAVVQRALDSLRRVVGPLRARALTEAFVPSLRALVADVRRAGVPTTLTVARPVTVAVSQASAVMAYRVIAAALDGVAGPASVTVDQDGAAVTVSVSGASDPRDAGALARWARRADALGGHLERHIDGVTLVLPASLPVVLTSGATR